MKIILKAKNDEGDEMFYEWSMDTMKEMVKTNPRKLYEVLEKMEMELKIPLSSGKSCNCQEAPHPLYFL